MKLASIAVDGSWRLGAVLDGETTVAVLPQSVGSLDDVVRGGPAALDAVRRDLASAERVPLADVDLGAPLRRFNRDILCTGWNYWDHFEESKGKREGQDPAERPQHPPSTPPSRNGGTTKPRSSSSSVATVVPSPRRRRWNTSGGSVWPTTCRNATCNAGTAASG